MGKWGPIVFAISIAACSKPAAQDGTALVRCGAGTHEEKCVCVADVPAPAASTPTAPAERVKPSEADLVAVFGRDLTENGANPDTCRVCSGAGCALTGFKKAGERSFVMRRPDWTGQQQEARINVTAAVVEDGDTDTYPFVGKITYQCTGNNRTTWGVSPRRSGKTYQFAAKSQKWRAVN